MQARARRLGKADRDRGEMRRAVLHCETIRRLKSATDSETVQSFPGTVQFHARNAQLVFLRRTPFKATDGLSLGGEYGVTSHAPRSGGACDCRRCRFRRFGGKAGVAEFTELRWITIETGPQHYPI